MRSNNTKYFSFSSNFMGLGHTSTDNVLKKPQTLNIVLSRLNTENFMSEYPQSIDYIYSSFPASSCKTYH